VIGDGLSPVAVNRHAVELVQSLVPRLGAIEAGPVVVASGARVALGDEIGELLGARMVAVLIGERPGLSAPDSLGVYLTYGPRPDTRDADRNCISNIRAGGLSYELTAHELYYLLGEARRRKLSGVALTDEAPLLERPLHSTLGAAQ
jgi:ethanolamine ammonia-lyase small subunit